MPYARKSRAPAKRRAPLARKRTYRKRSSTLATRYAKNTRLVSRRLNDGVQFKSSLYGDDIALLCGTAVPANHVHLKDTFISDIPKYRNDPTASSKQANLTQVRTSDKIMLRGFKVVLGVNNKSTFATHVRFMMIRAATLQELPSSNGDNWIKTLDGTPAAVATEMQVALTERFNYDLVRTRKDIIFDRRFIVGSTATLDGTAQKRLSFFVPLNHICVFESKGDTASADDLKTGKYTLMVWAANHDESNGGYTNFHYDINAVWAQA